MALINIGDAMQKLKQIGTGEVKTSKANNEYMLLEIQNKKYIVFRDKQDPKKLRVFINDVTTEKIKDAEVFL